MLIFPIDKIPSQVSLEERMQKSLSSCVKLHDVLVTRSVEVKTSLLQLPFLKLNLVTI